MTNHPTILATYQPQAWVNDYATDIDGAFTYDVTAQVLDQAIAHGWNWVKQNLTDGSDTAEFNLWELTDQRTDHTGPFSIRVEAAIEDYLDAFEDATGRAMTDMDAMARRDALRAAHEPSANPAAATVEATEGPAAYRVCVTYEATTQAEADTLALAVAQALRTTSTFPNPYRLSTPALVG